MDKLLERNQAVYSDAITARDSAQSLSDQAVVARDERDRLQQEAEQKMVARSRQPTPRRRPSMRSSAHLADLEAQLAALQDTTAKTIADYQAGVEPLAARKEEAERKARRRKPQPSGRSRGAPRTAAAAGAGEAVLGRRIGLVPSVIGWQSSGYGPRTVQCGCRLLLERLPLRRRPRRLVRIADLRRALPARSSTPARTAATATTSRSTTAAASARATGTSCPAASSSGTGSGSTSAS